MSLLPERTTIERTVEQTGTEYGFTWLAIEGKYFLRTADDQFKKVPEAVVDTLNDRATDTSIEELVAETSRSDPDAGCILQEMLEDGFVREGTPIERLHPPDDVRLWPRAVLVALLLCVGCVLWLHTMAALAGPVLENPLQSILGTAYLSIPLIVGSVVVHECGHYHAASRQGLDPSFGVSVVNGVIPAVVTRTHGGWALPRNRRMLNTLAGPAYGLVWTLLVFALYYTVGHTGLGIAGIVAFNFQFVALVPLFHGDGYLLLTDLFDEQNFRTRGIDDLRNGRPTWAAAYVAVSYGVFIGQFLLNLVVGYLVGDALGAGVVLVVVVAIYGESRLGVVERTREAVHAAM